MGRILKKRRKWEKGEDMKKGKMGNRRTGPRR